MNKSAKDNLGIEKLGVDELQARLEIALHSVPKKGKKFRYGAHFSVALALFEKLADNPQQLASTIEYLEARTHHHKHLSKVFRKACAQSFAHVSRKLEQHITKLSHVHDIDDINQVDKETYYVVMRRYTTLARLVKAMRQVHTDKGIVRASNSYIALYAPTIRKLESLFEPLKGPAITPPRRRYGHPHFSNKRRPASMKHA